MCVENLSQVDFYVIDENMGGQSEIGLYAFSDQDRNWTFNSLSFLGLYDESVIKLINRLQLLSISKSEIVCLECFERKIVKTKRSALSRIDLPWGCLVNGMEKFQWHLSRTFSGFKYEIVDGTFEIYLCDECIKKYNARNMALELIHRFSYGSPYKPFGGKIKESVIEGVLYNYPSLIEDGMTIVERQHEVGDGVVDLLCRDKNGQLCIVEVKSKADDVRLIFQCLYYPDQFSEKIRMITIAPGYSERIYDTLNNHTNTEMKYFTFDENDVLRIYDFAPIKLAEVM